MQATWRQLALLAAFTIPAVTALPQISVKGAKLFANGEQFFLKGVAYQGTPQDPLINTAQCTADADLMATIGTNSIRVYHVDPTVNHDGCMAAFADKGIYVWLDLDTFTTAIVQTAPAWEQWQFGNFTQVMDAFINYDNLAGFWVGNEVIDTAAGSIAAPYIKAAVADMKSYRAAKNYRPVPLGYSAADIAQLRPELQNYLACGDDYDQSIDFFGLNAYEWCGAATYESSGYVNLQAMSENYSVPIFFSETGCNQPEPRTFADQSAIFGPNMVGTWSGAIIYEWVQETNNYGLVTYPNGGIYDGAPIPIQPGYDNLASQWATITPSGVAEAAYTPSLSAPVCPGQTNGWVLTGAVPLPTLGAAVINAEAASVKPSPTMAPSSAFPAAVVATGSTSTPDSPMATTASGQSKATDGTSGSMQLSSTSSSTSTSKNAAISLATTRPEVIGGILGLGVLALI